MLLCTENVVFSQGFNERQEESLRHERTFILIEQSDILSTCKYALRDQQLARETVHLDAIITASVQEEEETIMPITFPWLALFAAVLTSPGPQSAPASGGLHTLTVVVENINREGGNIGVLVFNSTKGWPEDRFAALKDVVVPAQPGTVNVIIPGLPAGDYALAVLHDVNKNHKLDRNLFGVPKEQWGMSNNPHARIKAPPFSAARFSLTRDMQIHVRMQ